MYIYILAQLQISKRYEANNYVILYLNQISALLPITS